MNKRKSQHGGPRKAGLGKKMGRPRKFSEVMAYKGIRIPEPWATAIEEHGGGKGKFAEGIRRIIEASGVV
jgi:hypothetical protein